MKWSYNKLVLKNQYNFQDPIIIIYLIQNLNLVELLLKKTKTNLLKGSLKMAEAEAFPQKDSKNGPHSSLSYATNA